MPKCTINGKELEVKEGTTIIQAMTENHMRIAHYCWHPGLSVAGVCRLCMVEIEGNPRVQIACNTVVTEGMKINNTSAKVKDAAKWGLDFHLINHPLDCPICDQAGECGLQDQYMEFGKYDPEMAERKVKKKKVVDLGPTVVLDSERCILCSRCVRFTDEVTKTNELGIFNRGDRAEIGTFDGKPLANKYSLNTVDICPVGALTSKDFRFRQRVWYLKDDESICTGCSTGCNVKVYFNKEGFFRVKPKFNAEVNGHWMCDEGRDIYKFLNLENRLTKAWSRQPGQDWKEAAPSLAAREFASAIGKFGSKVGLVLTGQYSVEEYEAVLSQFVKKTGSKKVYHWINNPNSLKDFDGLLLRGDRNPNTAGLEQVLKAQGLAALPFDNLEKDLKSKEVEMILVAGPENQKWFPDFAEKMKVVSLAQNVVWMQAGRNESLMNLTGQVLLLPLKTFVEKEGTYVNFSGRAQKVKKVTSIVPESLSLTEAAGLLFGEGVTVRPAAEVFVDQNRRPDQITLENRKKNEFVFRRGSL